MKPNHRGDYPIIQSVYAINPSNLGDMASCPLQYFRFLRDGKEVRTMHLHVRNEVRKARNHPTIIGGGGLLKRNNPVADWVKECQRFAIWGAGVNENGVKGKQLPPSYWRGSPVGFRDSGTGATWAPCASCMHPLIDEYRNTEPRWEVAVYEGWDSINYDPFGCRRLSCWGLRNLRQAFAFLASAQTIITSSYHGAYWATLLGRRVAVIPELHAAKFYHLRWPVPLGEVEDIPRLVDEAKIHPHALDEAREATVAFAARVAEFLGMEVQRSEPNIC